MFNPLSSLSMMFLVAFALLSFGCSGKTEPEEASNNSTKGGLHLEGSTISPKYDGPPPESAKVVKLTIDELVDSFSNDREKLYKEYGDKWIEFSGRMAGFEIETTEYDDGTHAILMSCYSLENSRKYLRVFMRDPKPWEKVNVDSTVNVRACILKHEHQVVVLDHGTFVGEINEPMPQYSIGQILHDVKDDIESAIAKYTNPNKRSGDLATGFFVVTGTLERTKPGKGWYFLADGSGERLSIPSNVLSEEHSIVEGTRLKYLSSIQFKKDDEGIWKYDIRLEDRIDYFD